MASDDERLAAIAADELIERAPDVLVGEIDRFDTVAFRIEKREQRGLPIARCKDAAAFRESARLDTQGGIDAATTGALAGVIERRTVLARAEEPIRIDPKLIQLRADAAQSKLQMANLRLTGAQDLVWALVNTPAFLFNR